MKNFHNSHQPPNDNDQTSSPYRASRQSIGNYKKQTPQRIIDYQFPLQQSPRINGSENVYTSQDGHSNHPHSPVPDTYSFSMGLSPSEQSKRFQLKHIPEELQRQKNGKYLNELVDVYDTTKQEYALNMPPIKEVFTNKTDQDYEVVESPQSKEIKLIPNGDSQECSFLSAIHQVPVCENKQSLLPPNLDFQVYTHSSSSKNQIDNREEPENIVSEHRNYNEEPEIVIIVEDENQEDQVVMGEECLNQFKRKSANLNTKQQLIDESKPKQKRPQSSVCPKLAGIQPIENQREQLNPLTNKWVDNSANYVTISGISNSQTQEEGTQNQDIESQQQTEQPNQEKLKEIQSQANLAYTDSITTDQQSLGKKHFKKRIVKQKNVDTKKENRRENGENALENIQKLEKELQQVDNQDKAQPILRERNSNLPSEQDPPLKLKNKDNEDVLEKHINQSLALEDQQFAFPSSQINALSPISSNMFDFKRVSKMSGQRSQRNENYLQSSERKQQSNSGSKPVNNANLLGRYQNPLSDEKDKNILGKSIQYKVGKTIMMQSVDSSPIRLKKQQVIDDAIKRQNSTMSNDFGASNSYRKEGTMFKDRSRSELLTQIVMKNTNQLSQNLRSLKEGALEFENNYPNQSLVGLSSSKFKVTISNKLEEI